MISFLKTRNTLEIIVDGVAYSIDKSNPSFDKIINAIRTKEPEVSLVKLLDIAKTLTGIDARIVVENGQVTYLGEELHGTMIDRIFELQELDLDAKPVISFVEALMRNPDRATMMDLYDFLEVGKLPITDDGHFLAYKVVRNDYLDKHSGTMDNSPGKVVEMPRANVNNNRNQTCSSGLHFCSFDYIKVFLTPGNGDRIVLVKVDPADVVSIPADYNNTKARCCRYVVLKDVTTEMIPEDTYDSEKNDILRDRRVWQDNVIESPSTAEANAAPVVEEEEVEDHNICPHCGSGDTVRKGAYVTSKGQYRARRKCNECGTGFSHDAVAPVGSTVTYKPRKPKVKKKVCGECGSENIVGVSGQAGSYFCKDCHSITDA